MLARKTLDSKNYGLLVFAAKRNYSCLQELPFRFFEGCEFTVGYALPYETGDKLSRIPIYQDTFSTPGSYAPEILGSSKNLLAHFQYRAISVTIGDSCLRTHYM